MIKYLISLILISNLMSASSEVDKLNLTVQEKQWIQKNTIKVGVSPWYPITYFNDNKSKISGIGIDILNHIVKKFNLKIQYVPEQWSILLDDFKSHKIDMLPTTYYTKQRASFGEYTSSYMSIKEFLYVKQNSKIGNFADLKGKSIAIVKSYGTISKIKTKYPTIKIIEVDTLDQTVQMVLNGKVDAIFNTQFSIEAFLKDNFISGLKPIFQTVFKPSGLHYFINTQKPILHSIMQKGIDDLSDDEKNIIISKWIKKVQYKQEINVGNKIIKYKKDKKVIKVCTNPDWTPIEFTINDKPQGISIDTLKIIEENIKIPFEFIKTTSWKQSQEFLKQRKCDILSSAIKTKKRLKYANFTKPYLKYNLAIITKKDKQLVQSLESIIDKSMSRKEGSGLISKLKSKYPNINIKETKGFKEAFEAVANNKVYFTIATSPILNYYKIQYGLDDLQIAGYTNMKYKLCIAVRNDDKILLEILDNSLSNISSSQHKLIYEKWISKKFNKNIDYTLIWKILIIVFIIILFFIYRQYILLKTNKNLEQLQNIIENKSKVLEKSLLTISKHIIYSRTNLKGIIIEVSDAFCEISQYSKNELIGKSHNIIRHSDIPQEKFKDMWRAIKSGKTWKGEIKNRKKDGSYYWVYAEILPEFDDTGKIVSYIAIRHDITAKKDFEVQHKQLIQSERLASMGEIIGNIAHQWRQPLSVITTASSGMQMQKEYGILSDEQFNESCEAINNNAQYLSKTIDDFKNFIKGDRIKAIFSLKDNIDSFLHLVESSIKAHNIKIILDLQENIKIDGYENELIQCYINIFNNAKDILEEKDIDDKLIFITTKQKKNRVTIEIKDNAGGVPQDILLKIFEPYFTTKHKSQGTGLGLHMVYDLVVNGMDGNINILNKTFKYQNKLYTGACFSIVLNNNII